MGCFYGVVKSTNLYALKVTSVFKALNYSVKKVCFTLDCEAFMQNWTCSPQVRFKPSTTMQRCQRILSQDDSNPNIATNHHHNNHHNYCKRRRRVLHKGCQLSADSVKSRAAVSFSISVAWTYKFKSTLWKPSISGMFFLNWCRLCRFFHHLSQLLENYEAVL